MGFDVTMADADLVEIEKASEELVGVEFEQAVRHYFLPRVVLDGAVDSIWVVLHYDVKELLRAILSEKCVFEFQNIYMV